MINDSTDKLAIASETPDIKALAAELSRSSFDSTLTTRSRDAENIRFNRWDGQSSDGRKWQSNQPVGKTVFPWDGSSDTKISLVDDCVNSMVDLCTTSFWRSTLKVNGVDPTDQEAQGASQRLMDWLVLSRMYSNLTSEVEVLAQIAWTYGWGALHITWQRETQLKMQHLKLEEIVALAEQAPPDSVLADLPAMIAMPEQEDALAEILIGMFPSLKKKRALRCVRELRDEGECEFPRPVVRKNAPEVAALSPYTEFAFPPETTDLQSARVMFRREFMSEAQLRSKALDSEWDEEWVEAAVRTAGQSSSPDAQAATLRSMTENDPESTSNLIEVVYSYARQVDEDGVAGIWYTVFCPSAVGDGDKDLYGEHELLEYEHGCYPFIVYRPEKTHRKIADSRGVPEIAATWQQEVKIQRDSIADYTSISTIPPIEVPKNRGGGPLRIGPGVQVPVLRRSEIGFMEVPRREPGVAFSLIDHIEMRADSYFGRTRPDSDPVRPQMRQQRVVNNWLHCWTECFKQVFSLCLQFMDPMEIQRVTNSQAQISSDSERYDLVLKFDVRELNPDYMQQKLEAVSKFVLPADSAGVIDRAKTVQAGLRSIDPALAAELVQPQAQASQRMYEEQRNAVGQMSLGNEAIYPENDPAAQLKMQMVQDIVQKNPKYQMQLQQDPLFQQLMQKYAESLQFSAQQQQNAQIGRIGVTPNA
jgi:hypothetical protein